MINLNPVLNSRIGKLLVGDTNSTGKFTNLSYSELVNDSSLSSSGNFLIGTSAGSSEFRIQTSGTLKWSVSSNGSLSSATASDITTGGKLQSPTLQNIGFTDLSINSNNAGIKFFTSNTSRWDITSTGHFQPATSGTLNIGSSSNPVNIITSNNLTSSPSEELKFGIGGTTRWLIEPNSGGLHPDGAGTLSLGTGARPCSEVWTRVLTSDEGENLVFAENGGTRWTMAATTGNLTPSENGTQSLGSTSLACSGLFTRNISSDTSQALNLQTGGTTRWTMEATTGNLTPSANATQSLGSTSLACSGLFTRNISSDGSNNLNLQVGGSTKVYITAAGDLIAGGVSTTYLNVDNILNINNETITTVGDMTLANGQWLRLYAGGTERWRMFGGGEFLAVQASVNHYFGTHSNTPLFIRTANVDRFYFDHLGANLNGTGNAGFSANGNLLLGTVNNAGSQETRIITGFGGEDPSTVATFNRNKIRLQCRDVIYDPYVEFKRGALLHWFFYSSDNALDDGLFGPGASNAYRIGNAYNIVHSITLSTNPIVTSDIRDKNTITPSTLGLDFINNLNPVSYKFNVGRNSVTEVDGAQVITPISGVRTHWGLIAQEVAAAVPSGIDFAGWVLADLEDPLSPQALRYEQFICPLIKAIQELTARVQTLENP